jgi:hypothetical protein
MTIEQEIAEALQARLVAEGFVRGVTPMPNDIAPHIARALEDAWAQRHPHPSMAEDVKRRTAFDAAFVAGLRGNDE